MKPLEPFLRQIRPTDQSLEPICSGTFGLRVTRVNKANERGGNKGRWKQRARNAASSQKLEGWNRSAGAEGRMLMFHTVLSLLNSVIGLRAGYPTAQTAACNQVSSPNN